MVLCKNTLPHDVRLYGATQNVAIPAGETRDVASDIAASLPNGVRKVEVASPKRKKSSSPKRSAKPFVKPSAKPSPKSETTE